MRPIIRKHITPRVHHAQHADLGPLRRQRPDKPRDLLISLGVVHVDVMAAIIFAPICDVGTGPISRAEHGLGLVDGDEGVLLHGALEGWGEGWVGMEYE